MSDYPSLNDSTTPEQSPENLCLPTDVGQLHKRLTLNALSNLACYFVAVVVAFFMTPFVVKTLGNSFFGFWTILLSFVGYAGILELGVQTGVVKLVAQYRASGNTHHLNRVVNTAFWFFTSIGTLAAIVIVVLLMSFSESLIRDAPPIAYRGLLFALIGIDVALMFLLYVFTGILFGWQMYHAKNVVSIAALLVYAALVVAFLKPGAVLTLAAVKTATDFLVLAITFVLCRRVLPGLKLRPRLVTSKSFLELFGFAGKIFISATTTRLTDNTYPIILGYWLSAAAVTFFAIPSRLVGYATQISLSLTTSFMPTFSDLHSRNEFHLLRSIYIRYSRYILLVAMPMMALIFVYGPDFIALWIGPSYAMKGKTTLYLLTGAALMQGSQPLMGRLFIGIGKVYFIVLVSVVASLVSLLLSIILIGKMGIAAVGCGIFIAAVIIHVMTLIYACQYFQLSILSLTKKMHFRPFIVGVLSLLVAKGLSFVLGADSYVQLLQGFICTAIVYIVVVYIIGLEKEERLWLSEKITALLQRIPAIDKGKSHKDSL